MLTIPGYNQLECIRTTPILTVYRGLRLSDGLPVILRVWIDQTAAEYRPFGREYALAHSLMLDGIARPCAIEDDGRLLVLEDFGAVMLDDLIATGPLDGAAFFNIAIQVTSILSDLHRRGVIHLDLQPSNILVNPADGQVKITGLGYAFHPDHPHEIIVAGGDTRRQNALAYTAPEQLRRAGQPVDQRADLYAWGTILYELLAGQTLFAAADPLELTHAHLALQPRSLLSVNPHVPSALAAIVMRLLAKSADERYQSAAGLKADLEACLNAARSNQQFWGGSTGQAPRHLSENSVASPQQPAISNPLDMQIVAGMMQALSGEISMDQLLTTLLKLTVTYAGAQKGFLILEEDGSLFIEAEIDTTLDIMKVVQSVALETSARLAVEVVHHVRQTGTSIILDNAAQDSRFASDPYIAQHRPKSILCIPVLRQCQLVGIVYLENNLVNAAFVPEQLRLIHLLAAQAAISLYNDRLCDGMRREVAERQRGEEALRAMTVGTAAVTGDEFFRSLAQHLAAIFRVRQVFVAECTDSSKTRVHTLAYVKDDVIGANFAYDLEGTPCAQVIDGQAVFYPNHLSEHFAHAAGFESYLGVPVYNSSGQILGHLSVMDDKAMSRSETEISVMKIFAARAGAELERMQAEAALRQREEQLSQLNIRLEDYSRNLEHKVAERTREIEQRRKVAEGLRDMLTILNSNRPLDEILDHIIAEGSRLLGTDSGAIFRLQPDQEMLAVQAARGLPREYVTDLTFPLRHSFLGRAVLSRRPFVVADVAVAVRDMDLVLAPYRRKLLAENYQTILAVPLIRQSAAAEVDAVYGGIALYFPRTRVFSDEELELSKAFADQAALAIENAWLRQQVRQAAVKEERSRLARELHDSVTQSLYSLTLLVEGWRRLAQSGRMPNVIDSLAELGDIAQQALKEMRLLVHELRPPALEKEGLLGALHERLSSVERRAGVEARVLADEMIDLPASVEEAFYRIAIEALNNALKHAAATATTIYVRTNDRQVELEVVDNGKGFDLVQTQDRGGIGLISMRERAEKLGALFTITSAPGQGTRVHVQMQPPPDTLGRIAQH
ncbi:MAG: GAF domain-containing protein [Chloroflexales bacterium]|nr:GAF domain-containing protein [Chloroflexales bacterium]